MTTTGSKTAFTDDSVDAYLASRASGRQYADCMELMALLAAIVPAAPRMWGPSIVGFGACRYVHDSGRNGEAPLAAFAIRGRELVVYLDCEGGEHEALLSRLGKHRKGRSCLYFRQLGDLDGDVLRQLIASSVAGAKARDRRQDT